MNMRPTLESVTGKLTRPGALFASDEVWVLVNALAAATTERDEAREKCETTRKSAAFNAAQAEAAESRLRSGRESHDATLTRLRDIEAAAQALLSDDDMPNHWEGCFCSYCARYRALRAALAVPVAPSEDEPGEETP